MRRLRYRIRSQTRRAAILSEAIMAATILLAGIGIVARSHHNLRRLWMDTRQFQLATDELCNQMDRLTKIPKAQLSEELAKLQMSREIAELLPKPKIEGQFIEDTLGSRLVLKVDWKRVGSSTPLQLTGWLQVDLQTYARSSLTLRPQESMSYASDHAAPQSSAGGVR
jgi:hypothetical protein